MIHEIFLQGMAMVVSCHKITIEEKSLAVFEMLLNDIGDEDFMEAIINLCRYMNRLPGENLAAIIRNQVERQDGLSAEEAWSEVRKAVCEIGSWGDPKFSKAAIKLSVDALGWKIICMTEDSQLGVLRAHFFRVYDSFIRRQGITETRQMLIEPSVSRMLEGIAKKISE